MRDEAKAVSVVVVTAISIAIVVVVSVVVVVCCLLLLLARGSHCSHGWSVRHERIDRLGSPVLFDCPVLLDQPLQIVG